MNTTTKIALFLLSYFVAAYAGYHYKSVQVDAAKMHDAETRAEAAAEGTSKVIKFNQDYEKAKKDAQDTCVDKPMPAGIRKLL